MNTQRGIMNACREAWVLMEDVLESGHEPIHDLVAYFDYGCSLYFIPRTSDDTTFWAVVENVTDKMSGETEAIFRGFARITRYHRHIRVEPEIFPDDTADIIHQIGTFESEEELVSLMSTEEPETTLTLDTDGYVRCVCAWTFK